MSGSEIVVGVLGALLAVGGLAMLPVVWRGWFTRRESRFRGQLRTHGELATIWWPFSETTRRGLLRGFVPMAFAASGAVIGYWVAALNLHGGVAGPYAPRVAKLAAYATVAWFAIGFLLMLTILFFNWPKWLVPPGQRAESGVVAEWRSARRRRRS